MLVCIKKMCDDEIMKKNNNLYQYFVGGMIILIGAGFLLQSLDLVDFEQVVDSYWPLAIIAIGALSLSSNPRRWPWPVFIMIAGITLLLRSLDIVQFDIWNMLWPIILIGLGVTFIFNRTNEHHESAHATLHEAAMFTGINKTLGTRDFKGGDVNAIFGGVEINLADASIKKNATIDIFAMFGGVEITVPPDWEIDSQVLAIFGGVELPRSTPKNPKKTLHLRGTCLFGGIEIKR